MLPSKTRPLEKEKDKRSSIADTMEPETEESKSIFRKVDDMLRKNV